MTRQGGSLAQQHSLRKCRAATCACALAAGVSGAWRQWQGQTEAAVVLCYVLCSRVRLMAKGACGLDMAATSKVHPACVAAWLARQWGWGAWQVSVHVQGVPAMHG